MGSLGTTIFFCPVFVYCCFYFDRYNFFSGGGEVGISTHVSFERPKFSINGGLKHCGRTSGITFTMLIYTDYVRTLKASGRSFELWKFIINLVKTYVYTKSFFSFCLNRPA